MSLSGLEYLLCYWKNQYYYGAGAGSHGYVDGRRYYNIAPVPHYIKAMEQGSAVKETHEVSLEESMEEFMFLGLRMNEGISKDDFFVRYHQTIETVFGEVLTELSAKQLIDVNDLTIRLTPAGRMIGNDVFEKFLLSV